MVILNTRFGKFEFSRTFSLFVGISKERGKFYFNRCQKKWENSNFHNSVANITISYIFIQK